MSGEQPTENIPVESIFPQELWLWPCRSCSAKGTGTAPMPSTLLLPQAWDVKHRYNFLQQSCHLQHPSSQDKWKGVETQRKTVAHASYGTTPKMSFWAAQGVKAHLRSSCSAEKSLSTHSLPLITSSGQPVQPSRPQIPGSERIHSPEGWLILCYLNPLLTRARFSAAVNWELTHWTHSRQVNLTQLRMV